MINNIIKEIIPLLIILLFFWSLMFQKRDKPIDLMDIFKDDNNNLSFIRFGSMVCLLLLVWLVKFSAEKLTDKWLIILVFIVALSTFAPKALQKFAESKISLFGFKKDKQK